MKINKKVLLVALLMASPNAAFAGPSYDYLEIGLASGGYDWLDLCTNSLSLYKVSYYASGYQLQGAKSIGDKFFVDGKYNSLSMDVANAGCTGTVSLDATDYGINFGWHGENLYAKLGYESYDYFCSGTTICGPTDTGTGYALDAGYRGSLSDAIEYSAHLGYADINIATVIRYGFGFGMMLGDNWGVSFSYDIANYDFDFFTEDDNLITVNARWTW